MQVQLTYLLVFLARNGLTARLSLLLVLVQQLAVVLGELLQDHADLY